MTSRLVRFLGLAVVLGACGGADRARQPTAPASGAAPTSTVAESGAAAGAPDAGTGGLAALDIEMDEGNDGVAALMRASLKAGCKVQRKQQDGHPSLISECPAGLFGAVQVGTTLSIRCVDMAIGDCELFVLSILDAAEGEGAAGQADADESQAEP